MPRPSGSRGAGSDGGEHPTDLALPDESVEDLLWRSVKLRGSRRGPPTSSSAGRTYSSGSTKRSSLASGRRGRPMPLGSSSPSRAGCATRTCPSWSRSTHCRSPSSSPDDSSPGGSASRPTDTPPRRSSEQFSADCTRCLCQRTWTCQRSIRSRAWTPPCVADAPGRVDRGRRAARCSARSTRSACCPTRSTRWQHGEDAPGTAPRA